MFVCFHRQSSDRCRRADCDDEEESSSSGGEEEEESDEEEGEGDQEVERKEKEREGAIDQERGIEVEERGDKKGHTKPETEGAPLNDEAEIEGFTDLAVRLN